MTQNVSAWRVIRLTIVVGLALGSAAYVAFFREVQPSLGDALAGRREKAAAPPEFTLRKIAEGFVEPTDIQFPPGQTRWCVVLEKRGTARWLDRTRGLHGELFSVAVRTASEQGLLGLAFHPHFAQNGRFFLNYVASAEGKDVTRIVEWSFAPASASLNEGKSTPVRTWLEVTQPYANHNAGQLAFGPDGNLYIGFGDGGSGNDPHNHGQDKSTLLGSMLRVDVDQASDRGNEAPYAIPKDNPFLGDPSAAPETFAYGLRNPWRYSFDPRGRLIVADVGQNAFEEIDIVEPGDNLGWNIREGFSCTELNPAGCSRQDLVAPVVAYSRELGNSVTGGYVYLGKLAPALRGQYIFGDFGSGRLFAIELPEDRHKPIDRPRVLGQWPIHPSTFGQDAEGEIYVADFSSGSIYQIDAPENGAQHEQGPASIR